MDKPSFEVVEVVTKGLNRFLVGRFEAGVLVDCFFDRFRGLLLRFPEELDESSSLDEEPSSSDFCPFRWRDTVNQLFVVLQPFWT